MPSAMIQQLRILWAAIFASTIVIFVVGSMVQPFDLTVSQTNVAIFGALAVMLPIGGAVFVRQTFRSAIRGLNLAVREEPTSAEPKEGYRGASLSRKVIADPNAAVRVLRVYHVSTIIALALSEVPALLGLVLRAQGAGMFIGLGFAAISWIAIGLRFPTLGRAYAVASDVTGAAMPG
jgi:hypothetical protein